MSELRTTDARQIEILSPGRMNDGSGPDVRGAVIRIGGTVFSGDVEFHRTAPEWDRHEHHRQPSYNTVILHVVLHPPAVPIATYAHSGRVIPILPLLPYLTRPLDELLKQYQTDERTATSLACCGLTHSVPSEIIRHWLLHLDAERLESRMHQFQERLWELVYDRRRDVAEPWKRYGQDHIEGSPEEIPLPEKDVSRRELSDRRLWEQVLYESVMEGLGYSRNREPFIRLARILSLSRIRSLHAEDDRLRLLALFYGVAGLIPVIRSMKESVSKHYVRILRRHWLEWRTLVRTERMNLADWQFSPTRPQNFPTLRINAAAQLVNKIICGNLFQSIIQIIKNAHAQTASLKSLRRLFAVEPDPFWSTHFHFDRPAKRPMTPLGTDRIDDILVNAVFPLCLLYARVFADRNVRRGVLELRDHSPLLASNNTTRIVERELFAGRQGLETLRLQQGGIQLYRQYCARIRCAECEIGKRVFAPQA